MNGVSVLFALVPLGPSSLMAGHFLLLCTPLWQSAAMAHGGIHPGAARRDQTGTSQQLTKEVSPCPNAICSETLYHTVQHLTNSFHCPVIRLDASLTIFSWLYREA